MLQLLLKPARNKWHTLGLWIQLQLVLLALVVFSYLITNLKDLFGSLAYDSYLLSGLVISGFLLLNIFSAPFILKYAVPRRKSLYVFHSLPLTQRQVFQVLAYFYHSYQLPLIGLLFLTSAALTLIDPVAGFSALIISVICDLIIFFLSVTTAAYFRGMSVSDIHLEKLFPIEQHIFIKHTHRNTALKISRHSFLTLLKKELLSLWRNPHYRRLKYFTFLFYIFTLIALYFSGLKNKDMWMMFFSAAVFWIHYNVYFNSKYVSADPDWFFRTLPLKFYKVWFAKFLTEFLYVLLLLVSQWLFLIIMNIEGWILLNWIGALFLFAIIILSVVINFQILFYDNPRLAGYSYHFTIIFIVIMSINYHFVGPLTALFLLKFYFYKTYRFYNS